MKKSLKKIIYITLLLLLIWSLKIKAQNNEYTEIYKNRTINIFGVEITYQDKEYFSGENNIVTSDEKENNNIIVEIFAGFLVIYWIVLLSIFEKEESMDYTYDCSGDLETLKKYNPLIAGCLADNREVLARDVTAVILNLVQKQAINMKIVPKEEGKDTYKYIISENKNSNAQLDETEKYVLNWIFGFYEQDEIELVEKLKEISNRKDFVKRLKELNTIAQSKLNKMGANLNKVPQFLRIANVFLIIVSIMMSVIHIANNGLNIHIYETTMLVALIVLIAVIIILPIIALMMNIILLLTVIIKRAIKIHTQKNSGKQIVTTSVLILVTMFILIGVIYITVPNKYICLDIFIIGMSILIVKTDNLMTKHNKEIMNDYYALQEIKNRIEEYTLIEEKGINYIKLWEEYLVYAIAFGIPLEILDKLRDTSEEDEDIEYLLKGENLYYICKAYFEVMWDIDFKERKKKSEVSNIFKELI
jgi:hypothetical protein